MSGGRVMVRIKYLAVSASIFAASGCAGLPDARIQYYPAMATTELKVIQTIACTPDKQQLVTGHVLKR